MSVHDHDIWDVPEISPFETVEPMLPDAQTSLDEI